MASCARGEAATGEVEAPAEVLEFIRFCYRRRGFGWPELYDEMCAVAARGTYRGMDYDALGRLGIGFSLREMPRLAALAQAVVAEERRTRQAPARPGAGRRAPIAMPVEGAETGAGMIVPAASVG